MAEDIWSTPVDKDTPDETLERMADIAGRTDHDHINKKAGEAKAEITKRDRLFQTDLLRDELNGRSTLNEEHIAALRKLNDDQISATEDLTNAQLRIAKASAWAAGLAAIAAIGILIMTAINVFGGSRPDNQSIVDAIDRQTDAILRKTTD